MGSDNLRDPTDLQWMSGILITVLVFYSFAMLIVFLILLLLGAFIHSLLFDSSLFTQEEFFLAWGFILYLLGGFILLFSIIGLGLLKRRVKKQLSPKEKGSRIDPSIIIVGSFLIVGIVVTGIFSLSRDSEFIIFTITTPIILGILLMNWQVIDIPAKTLALLGKKKVLRLSRDASVPLLAALLGFIPIIYSVGFEDAPQITIYAVYLETLFAMGVMTTFVSITVMLYHLNKQIKEMKGLLDLEQLGDAKMEDTRLFLSKE
jgi:hypothetical protein